MSDPEDGKRRLAVQVARDASPGDREILRVWAGELLQLREQDLPVMAKAKQAVAITLRARVVWPLLKTVSKQVKRHGWDKRTASQRLGMAAAGAAVAIFGPAQAGIAALGSAVAVPLWVVFGAGAMFARHLYEELSPNKVGQRDATYKTIDVEKNKD